MILDNKRVCGLYGARATKSRHAAQWNIEGCLVNTQAIADRLNISPKTARKRILRESRKPGQTTWEALSK